VYFVAPLVLLFGIVWAQPHFFPGKSSIVTWRGFIPVAAGVAVGTWLLLAWLEVPLEFVEIDLPLAGYFTVVAMLIVSGLMLGALGMLLSSWIKQLENFAGIMNFVIFPMFFASSALYPLWKMRESSEILYYICLYNPFTGAVEIIRHALYGQIHWGYLAFTAACTLVFLALAVLGYDPGRGLITRKAGAGAGA
jgi:ABC-2 type transport system permease protein